MPFALGLTLGNLGEGSNATEPNIVDPSPGLGDCGEQSVPVFGPHRPFCTGRMNNALQGREALRGPCERDRGRQGAVGSRVLEAVVFGLSRCLAIGNEADFQCLRFDDHARDMVFDQVAVRRLPVTHCCEVPADPFAHEGLDLGGRHAGDAACFDLPILQNRLRHIVPVTHAELVRMRRAHAVAAVVEEAAGQNGGSAPEPDLVGAGIAKAGIGTVVWSGVIKTGSAIVFSPALGFVLALFLVLAVSWIFVRRTPLAVDNIFRSLQFVSASFYSLGHGGNDAQKTMGIIAVLLFSHGKLGGEFHVPFWVVLSCQMAMGLGTLFGGWRIVHTMGSKITKLTPMQGFCAETGGAITLFLATGLGIPVSTTHTITGAIVGVGAARRVSAVRWNIAKNIVVAWVITMPMAGIIAAIFYALARLAG